MAREFAKKGAGHGLLAREIASPAAFDNAMILDMAMGGSTNTVLHILAIAHEAGVPFSLERIDELSKKTPNLCKVSPSSAYHIEDVARAGGIHTILGEVARGCPGLLDLSCMTVTGKTLGDNINEYDIRAQDRRRRRPAPGRTSVPAASAPARPGPCPAWPPQARSQAAGLALLEAEGEDGEEEPRNARQWSWFRIERPRWSGDGFDPFDVIRTVDNAYSATGGLTMLTGNLAPKGAVVKTAGVSPKMLKHTGPAVIFDSEIDAYNGIVFDKVKAGDVVVIRYEGPKGGPGMQEMLAPTTAIKGVGLGDNVRPDHRRPILRRDRRRIDRPRQPRGGRRRPDRPLARRRHHRHRYPQRRPFRPALRPGARRPPCGLDAAQAQGHLGLPRPLRQDGHQRGYRGDPQVGLILNCV